MKTTFLARLRGADLLLAVALFSAFRAGGAEAPAPYLRVARPSSDEVKLEVVARQFKPVDGNGPIIWLTGVTHVGNVAYYDALQKHLDEQDVVLFEGVGERPPKPVKKVETKKRGVGDRKQMHSVQGTLADSLGLVFQLESIDYHRGHFKNSDLSVSQIRWLLSGGEESELPERASADLRERRMRPKRVKPSKPSNKSPEPKRGNDLGDGRSKAEPQSDEPPSGSRSATSRGSDSQKGETSQSAEQFDRMLSMMDGSSAMGAIVDSMLRFIGTSPKLKAITRLMFIEVLGGLKGDLANTQAIPPELREVIEVLIRSRNKEVVKDLRTELAKAQPPNSISVFYGAGHMDDLERRLREELNYAPGKDEWFEAFAVNTREAGINAAEKALIKYMLNIQMQMLNSQTVNRNEGRGGRGEGEKLK